MADNPEIVEALPAGWHVGVDRNPITGKWHWIIWSGPASFKDKAFVAAYNQGLAQIADTREEAIEIAVNAALDRQAGIVMVPLFDTTNQPILNPDA